MGKPYVKSSLVWLKDHDEYNEAWVRDRIREDPSILGLGELSLKDTERRQPRAGGYLDLLLQDPGGKRYEVELQLGKVDPSHIIRAIEYWDEEKRRYPQFDHCAVLIAEDITSRFLNVISLFNGTVPLIAIQMQALSVGDQITLTFVEVMSESSRGTDDENKPVNCTYWEEKATKETVDMAKQVLEEILNSLDGSLNLKYNKYYIGLKKGNDVCNFVTFCPLKDYLKLFAYLPQAEEIDKILTNAGFEQNLWDYRDREECYRLWLTEADIESKKDALMELAKRTHAYYWEG